MSSTERWSNWKLICFLVITAWLCEAAGDRVVVTRPKGMRYDTLLTIDGGGLRALMSNQILKEFEMSIKQYFIKHPELLPAGSGEITDTAQLEVHLADFFDVMGGVSAGSWVALYYASKGGNGHAGEFLSRPDIVKKYGERYAGSAEGLDVFFLEFGGIIYPPGILSHLPTPRFEMTLFPFNIPGVNSPRYPVKGLEKGLRAFFGETKMSELSTSCIINAYDTNKRNPVLFTHNNYADPPLTATTIVRSTSAPLFGERRQVQLERFQDDLDIHPGEDFYILEVARASSALPAFHIAQISHPIGNETQKYVLIDGALPAPNPALHTTNFMLRMQQAQGRRPNLREIATVSVGTGYAVGNWEDRSSSVGRGALGWLLSGDILAITSDGGSEAMQSNINYLLYQSLDFTPLQFLRIQVFANQKDERGRETAEGKALSEFANPDNMQDLKRIGQQAAWQHSEMIEAFVERFIFAPAEEEQPTTSVSVESPAAK